MNFEIIELSPAEFDKCGNIWNMKQQEKLAKQFYSELISGNRITYVYKQDDEFIGEISLVFNMNDSDYTIDKQRIYVSRLIVKPEERRNGIGKKLVEYATDKAKEMGYSEMSIGVDLDNYPALKLYADSGFNKILFIGEDKQGKYVKLLKKV
jgi:ribosomal protein S18 acetylase RimI-like enzyme